MRSVRIKITIVSLFLGIGYFGTAQVQLDDYKYVIIPKMFDGFKKENQYQTSSLIKYLFTQKGFNAVYDDALPEDLTRDRCLGLLAVLVDNSSMFTTKTELVLKDCGSREVFKTQEGKSKLKEYKASYTEAIRAAFTSFNGISYNYTPKQEQAEAPSRPDPVVQQYWGDEPVASEIDKPDMPSQKKDIATAAAPASVLYAQQLPNGYQLVDSTPKIRFKIFKSSIPEYYLAETDDKRGIVYKKEGKWFFEYNEGEKVVIEELNIKF